MYAMVNLIAGKRIVPELIQDDCTPEAVADEAVRCSPTPPIARGWSRPGRGAAPLGGPGASQRAAEAVIDLVQRVGAWRRQPRSL